MRTGLEIFLEREYRKYQGVRLGLLCHPASVDRHLIHAALLLKNRKYKLNLTCLFGPQHGIRSEKQDNMVESSDFVDPLTKLPVFSLYGSTRNPTPKMLSQWDVLLVDLQDIGTRIYTYIYTLANCMRAAATSGKKIVVLDRPNPLGGIQLDGNILEHGFESFVGQFPILTQHGMTIGELALLFNEEFKISCSLDVIRMKGWRRTDITRFSQHWVPPSPNIPSFLSAQVFPGSVHFEGTNISEGRGTTRPFEWIGAPFINPDRLASEMNALKLGGVYFRPIYFQPTYQKWAGEVCGGVHIHVTDEKRFRPVQCGIRLLHRIYSMNDKFEWKLPPYEYEYERMPIDLIAGTGRLRELMKKTNGPQQFEERFRFDKEKFKKIRQPYLLYK